MGCVAGGVRVEKCAANDINSVMRNAARKRARYFCDPFFRTIDVPCE